MSFAEENLQAVAMHDSTTTALVLYRADVLVFSTSL
jgi:hypothetical protein